MYFFTVPFDCSIVVFVYLVHQIAQRSNLTTTNEYRTSIYRTPPRPVPIVHLFQPNGVQVKYRYSTTIVDRGSWQVFIRLP